jgi:AcrR family transcriptional regulator
MRRRRIQAVDRRREILLAALEIAKNSESDPSWECVDIRSTAARAGCSAALVKRYFKNRGELCRQAARLAKQIYPSTQLVIRATALNYL